MNFLKDLASFAFYAGLLYLGDVQGVTGAINLLVGLHVVLLALSILLIPLVLLCALIGQPVKTPQMRPTKVVFEIALVALYVWTGHWFLFGASLVGAWALWLASCVRERKVA